MKCVKILILKYEGASRCICKDNINVIVKNYGVMMWIGFIWISIGSSGRLREYRNDPSSSIYCEEYLD